jgi:hypothetical protein
MCTTLGAFLLAVSLLTAAENNKARRAAEVEEQMRKDITFLASDECEGRGLTTKGINLAADFIAEEFKKAGLQPIEKDSYFQHFSVITGAAKLDSPNTLVLKGPDDKRIELKLGEQFIPVGLSDAGKAEAPLVFVGYGATSQDIDYDDYKNMDVAGKIVLVLRKTPRSDNRDAPFDGGPDGPHAALTTKLVNAGLHKAAAVVFVNDRSLAKGGDALMDFAYTAGARQSFGVLAAQVRRSVADHLLQSGAGVTLKDLEADIDRDLKPHSCAIQGWSAALEINLTRVRSKVKNVIGVLEGAGDLAGETVVIGAHYDHLGFGGRGSGSLAKDQEAKEIHHGADDNGSGTSTLLEMARYFGALKERKGRRLVFIAFTGEEAGLLGSDQYCKSPIFPLADTVAMINLDMVGRLREDMTSNKDKLYIYGSGTSKDFDELLTGLNKEYEFQLQKIAGTRMAGGSSDHASFYAKKIPVLFLFTGNHPDYHRPGDTADKINIPGMRKIAEFTEEVVEHLASQAERPQYVKVGQGPLVSPGGGGPRLGIMPSYGDDQDGVLLDGVREGSPADKAELKEGDRIVELDGKPVKNLEAYMVLMAGHKKGDTLEILILRGGKKLTLKAKLE